jgi:hypothetical protein
VTDCLGRDHWGEEYHHHEVSKTVVPGLAGLQDYEAQRVPYRHDLDRDPAHLAGAAVVELDS